MNQRQLLRSVERAQFGSSRIAKQARCKHTNAQLTGRMHPDSTATREIAEGVCRDCGMKLQAMRRTALAPSRPSPLARARAFVARLWAALRLRLRPA